MADLHVLVDILVVLVAAKVAAELSERIGMPAVVGEILAGIVVGPSLLGAVEPTEVLRVLGEMGVILLLLDVGMEMDLGELRAVGRSSLTVAVVGIVAPFAGGLGVGAPSPTVRGEQVHTRETDAKPTRRTVGAQWRSRSCDGRRRQHGEMRSTAPARRA